MESFSIDNGLAINTAKTKAIKFRRGGKITNAEHFKLAGEKVEYVTSFSYLGIVLH